ncbi:MAG: AbrB/MazE/SpoVT family DNA-binding domain-containing protein [Candidatus Bathyarchaeia archaeon]
MLEEEMKVGSKGQVVIPKTLRKALKIHPGSRVIFRLEKGKIVLEKQFFDAVGTLENIAKKGPPVSRIDAHIYEEELGERMGKCST